MPDGPPNERVVGLYEENADAWARQRGRGLIEQSWLERFAALLPSGGSVLDIGCGSGEPIAGWFVRNGFSVTGVDSSPSLIAICRERFPEQRWLVADMRTLDLGTRWHGILAWHSFFHLSAADQRAMFPRFDALARPGAALMFTSGPEAGEKIGEWRGEPLFHASLQSEEYRQLLSESGFSVVAHTVSDETCGHATVWLAARDP